MENQIIRAPDAPEVDLFAGELANLVDERLGAEVVAVSDDFFAPAQRMLNPESPKFIVDLFDDNGKWMDGWESRRKRGPGHDWAVVRLGKPGRPLRVDVETTFFTGNYAPAVSIEGCTSDQSLPPASAEWVSLLDVTALGGDAHHLLDLHAGEQSFTHVRLNLFPDGGVARLRVFGRFDIDWSGFTEEVDLAACGNGAVALACSNTHYGHPRNTLMPGRGTNMADGWETRRRREPGHDWAIVALAHPGRLHRIVIDTAHFKGNFPHQCSVHAAYVPGAAAASLPSLALFWKEILPPSLMQADHVHEFTELVDLGVVNHLVVNMHPDGGISRLRAFGIPDPGQAR